MRLIIAGSRCAPTGLDAIEKLNRHLAALGWDQPTAVLCGTAAGGDELGRLWAEGVGVPVEEYPADWGNLGRKAGYVRNRQMAGHATHLFAIWDGESNGTRHMVDIARRLGLEVRVRTIVRPEKKSKTKVQKEADASRWAKEARAGE